MLQLNYWVIQQTTIFYLQAVNILLQLNSLFAQLVTLYKRLIYQNPNSCKRPFGININMTKNLWFIVNQNTAITLQVNRENQNAAITLQVNSETIR